MTNLDPEFCRKIKDARKRAKLGQTEVAAKVGCKQSALCMFENGGITKLNDEVIGKLSKLFNVELVTVKDLAAENLKIEPVAVPSVLKGFCPNPQCPTNHAYAVDGRTFLRPDRAAADPVGARYCAFCGEVLEKRCSNCGAPVHDGAVCSHCGEAYVSV